MGYAAAPIEIPRPQFGGNVTGFDQELYNHQIRQKEQLSLKQESLREYREKMIRKLPSGSFTESFLAPLITPEMRKKKMESLNKNQTLDYLESLRKPNQSGSHHLESKKRRFTLDAIKKARKETIRKEKLDRKWINGRAITRITWLSER